MFTAAFSQVHTRGSLVEIRGLSQYVCEWSRNVHVCGELCTEGERLKDNSGYVCLLN